VELASPVRNDPAVELARVSQRESQIAELSELLSLGLPKKDVAATRRQAFKLGIWTDLAERFPSVFKDAYVLRSTGAREVPAEESHPLAAPFIDVEQIRALVGKEVIVRFLDESGARCVVAGRLEAVSPGRSGRGADLRFAYFLPKVAAATRERIHVARHLDLESSVVKGYYSAQEVAPLLHPSSARGIERERIQERAKLLIERCVYVPRVDLSDPERHVLRDPQTQEPLTNAFGPLIDPGFVDLIKIEINTLLVPLTHELISRMLEMDYSEAIAAAKAYEARPREGDPRDHRVIDAFEILDRAFNAKGREAIDQLTAELEERRAAPYLQLAYDNLKTLVSFRDEVLESSGHIDRFGSVKDMLVSGFGTGPGAFGVLAQTVFELHRLRDPDATAEQMLATFLNSYPLVTHLAAAHIEVFRKINPTLWAPENLTLERVARGGDRIQIREEYKESVQRDHGVWLDTVLPATTKCPANFALKLGDAGNAVVLLQQKFGASLLEAFREEIAKASARRRG
jgi:hypothetical protein